MEKKLSSFNNQGFSLLELMVALALGLIVSAIAIQLSLTGQRGMASQQSLSDLQTDALFGLEAIVRDIRLANLNSAQPKIDHTVLHGGIVLNGANYTSKRTASNLPDITLVNALSVGGVNNSSNLAGQKSDELVIQYQNIAGKRYNCEGVEIPLNSYVVQRYFIREDENRNDPNKPYALACVAQNYTGDQPVKIDLSGKGQIIVPRVDHFSVMLGVAQDQCSATDTPDAQMCLFGKIPLANYLDLTDKPQIVSVEIGLLVRSINSVGTNNLYDANKEYQILNTKGKLTVDPKNQLYMRHIVSQTIALRNGFGVAK